MLLHKVGVVHGLTHVFVCTCLLLLEGGYDHAAAQGGRRAWPYIHMCASISLDLIFYSVDTLQELDSSQHRASVVVMDTEARAAKALEVARAEHDATLARHLSFMVRSRDEMAHDGQDMMLHQCSNHVSYIM